jgi:Putative beta-barrel porin 2
MRIYSVTLCSLAALSAWNVHQAVAVTPSQIEVSVQNTSKNFTVPDSVTTVAPPEIMEKGEAIFGSTDYLEFSSINNTVQLAQALPSGELNNPVNINTQENQSLDPKEVEDELGEIRIIKPRPISQPPQRRQPDVQLLLRSGAFTSSNITAVDFLQRSDTVFTNSATLLATPKLGENTRLVTSVTGGLTNFATKDEFNYKYLSFNAGVQQKLAPGMYGQLGWVQDRLYNDKDSRILLDDSVRLTIGRQDQLASQLRLDSFYDLRASFAEPKEQSRVANSLGARLRYDISPQLQGAIDYRLTFKNYTQQNRFDTQHQIGLDLIYNINQDLFIGSTASYLFGSSSASSIELDNFSIGINLGLNVPLF